MARDFTHLRILAASPSDVAEERALLEEVVRELNISLAPALNLHLDLVRWETNVFSGVGPDPQAVINAQIGDDYDMFIGIMWTKVGSRTIRAESGTIEEFQRAHERFRASENSIRIMYYFKDAAVSPTKLIPEQLKALNDFRQTIGEEGVLYFTFKTRKQFTSLIRTHLSLQMHEWGKSWGVAAGQNNNFPKAAEHGSRNEEDSDAEEEEEEEADPGMFDLAERSFDAVERLTGAANQITSATETMAQKLSQRTKELEIAQVPGKAVDVRLIRRIIDLAAADIEQWVATTTPQVDTIAEAYPDMASNFSRLAALQHQSVGIKQGETESIIAAFQTVSATFHSVQSSIGEMRNTIASLPPASSKLNRAKSAAIELTDRLTSELNTARTITLQLEQSLEEMVGGV